MAFHFDWVKRERRFITVSSDWVLIETSKMGRDFLEAVYRALTFYKWRAKFSGMDASMMKRLKELEDENKRRRDPPGIS